MRSTLPVFALLSATACFTPVSGNETVDADSDGIPAVTDCDDSDPSSTSFANDADCDGVITADDCNDDDPTSLTSVANDADCDGILTADDCDDNDPASAASSDADCDGILTADDCDDTDPTSTAVTTDADCDGIVTANDCDDNDSASTTVTTDADCDGTLTADDCDDTDAASTSLTQDADCDGTVTADDCDDTDAFSTVVANDADCDGIVTVDDCDDNDSTNSSGSASGSTNDADCDGVPTEDDCDDSDPNSTTLANDADCDGTPTTEDCDDADNASTTLANDGDCDGTLTTDDCDDFDPNSTILANDADCDTVLYEADCNDTDPSLLAKAGDPDCNGAQGVASVNVNDNAVGVDIDVTLTIRFRDPVDSSTLSGIRVGVSGILDGAQQTQWVSEMPGTLALRNDGRTVTWTPSRGRLQEFETTHWVEVAGVENINGQGMARHRRTFTTSVVDRDYVYRFENFQFDGSLANWALDDGTVAASLGEPFSDDLPSSRWVFEEGGGWYTMTNRWLDEGRLLEGYDGTTPAFMSGEGEGVYSGQQWRFVAAALNDRATSGTSPNVYWLETAWQGPDRTLGYHSQASTGQQLVGMKNKGGGVYADHVWILHNIGHR